MQRAVQLAQEVTGSTSPNPAVGAVLIKDGAVVGVGATQPPGQDHAEIVALNRLRKTPAVPLSMSLWNLAAPGVVPGLAQKLSSPRG